MKKKNKKKKETKVASYYNITSYFLTLLEIDSLGYIEPGVEVPKVTPGGRGSYRYMYDVCKCSGIEHINTSPTRGILFGQ